MPQTRSGRARYRALHGFALYVEDVGLLSESLRGAMIQSLVLKKQLYGTGDKDSTRDK